MLVTKSEGIQLMLPALVSCRLPWALWENGRRSKTRVCQGKALGLTCQVDDAG